ncbi:hypothetical protein M422DRAFT_260076, partial [Sphaerobolus stellatus SS14]
MSSISAHLNALLDDQVSVNNNYTNISEQDVAAWVRYSNELPSVSDEYKTLKHEELPWTSSVLDLPWSLDALPSIAQPTITLSSSSSSNPIEALYDKLASDPHVSPIIPALSRILSSPKKDDEISEELVELLGFDALDLVMEIIGNRMPLSYKLAIVDNEPVNSGKGAGAGRSGKGTPLNQSGRATPRGKGKKFQQGNGSLDFNPEEARRRMEKAFEANAARPLFTGTAAPAPEVLPHVYTSSAIVQGNVLSMFGSKYMLPIGTTREDREDCEEVIIPPARPVPPRVTERLITVAELDGLARGSFPGYVSLNRIQSIVYPTAYGTNENLLICAPTGAGKTDVAMLTILRVIDQNLSSPQVKSNPNQIAGAIKRDDFKVIYVCVGLLR